MLAKRVIPCLDVDAGRVKKGVRFKELRDAGEVAAAAVRAGAAAILYTDISRDGTRIGPNFGATEKLAKKIAPAPVVASGGVATLDDLDGLVKTGATAVVVGKAIYEQAFTVEEAVARARGGAA